MIGRVKTPIPRDKFTFIEPEEEEEPNNFDRDICTNILFLADLKRYSELERDFPHVLGGYHAKFIADSNDLLLNRQEKCIYWNIKTGFFSLTMPGRNSSHCECKSFLDDYQLTIARLRRGVVSSATSIPLAAHVNAFSLDYFYIRPMQLSLKTKENPRVENSDSQRGLRQFLPPPIPPYGGRPTALGENFPRPVQTIAIED